MSDGVTLSVYGNRGILDNLDKLQRHVIDGAQARLEQAGEMAKAYAEEIAPVSDIDTPGYVHMRDQYALEVEPGQIKLSNDSDHILYVELGTYKMAAQPTLVPAMEFGAQWFKDSLPGLVE